MICAPFLHGGPLLRGAPCLAASDGGKNSTPLYLLVWDKLIYKPVEFLFQGLVSAVQMPIQKVQICISQNNFHWEVTFMVFFS